MRTKARVDNNHKEIADTARQMGWSVISLAQLGKGVPDLLLGSPGINLLVEIKTRDGKLTEDQKDFFKMWKGPKRIIYDRVSLINLLNSIKKGGQNE